jgi:hypothetical protein
VKFAPSSEQRNATPDWESLSVNAIEVELVDDEAGEGLIAGAGGGPAGGDNGGDGCFPKAEPLQYNPPKPEATIRSKGRPSSTRRLRLVIHALFFDSMTILICSLFSRFV